MFSTFDGYGRRSDAWRDPAASARRTPAPPRPSLARFSSVVDRLFYVSLAAFAVTVIALIT